jgi:hypothetical protein
MLRTSSIGNRKFLHAEHCRYGTRDFASIEISELRANGELMCSANTSVLLGKLIANQTGTTRGPPAVTRFKHFVIAP